MVETERLVAQAPKEARPVIFHSAVLNYVTPQVRTDFQTLLRDLGVDWLANEGVSVLPEIAVPPYAGREGAFVLSLNGRALARTGPHGQFIDWIA